MPVLAEKSPLDPAWIATHRLSPDPTVPELDDEFYMHHWSALQRTQTSYRIWFDEHSWVERLTSEHPDDWYARTYHQMVEQGLLPPAQSDAPEKPLDFGFKMLLVGSALCGAIIGVAMLLGKK